MRVITIKYEGPCKRCNAILEIGKEAYYEKSMGCFCLGCEPKDTEEIRHFRQLKANKKIERLDEWAEKREKKAEIQLNSYPEIRGDISFNTQPGRIPFRARMIKADDKAYESLRVAAKMRDKAESLSRVRVAGDAERLRQQGREYLDNILNVGDRVFDFVFGEGNLRKKNKKTYTIKFDRLSRDITREKTFVKPL